MVLPGPANTRRQTLLTYFASNGVELARSVELDAMMGTLDTVAGSDWLTVLPGVMMARDLEHAQFTVNPIVGPSLPLDLVVIEPARRAMTAPALAFYDIIAEETQRLNACWAPYLEAGPGAGRARKPKRAGRVAQA